MLCVSVRERQYVWGAGELRGVYCNLSGESADSETRSEDSDWFCPYIYSTSPLINEFKLLLDNLFLLIDNKYCLQFSLLDKKVFYGTI